MEKAMILTFGESTVGSVRIMLRETGRRGVLARGCFDDLTIGPLCPFDDLRAFKRLRRSTRSESYAEMMDGIGERFSVRKPRSIDSQLKIAGEADRVEIWCAASLQEQVMLAFVAALAREGHVQRKKLHLVQFSEPPEFCSLGMMNPKLLARHPPAAPLGPENISDLARVWDALCAEDPSALSGLARAGTGRPFLDAAIRSMIARYPCATSGLGSIDLRLLRSASREFQRSALIVGRALSEIWVDRESSGDLVGDLPLFGRLRQLSDPGLPSPLFEFAGPRTADMRASEARLTEFGARCLAGEANHLEVNPEDTWIGGVHLSTIERTLWVRDGYEIKMLPRA